MKQLSIDTNAEQKKVNTPTSKLKFDVPNISETVEKIETEEAKEEISDEEIEGAFGLALLRFLLGRKKSQASSDNEKDLEREMEKVHPKEIKDLIKGCGCGF